MGAAAPSPTPPPPVPPNLPPRLTCPVFSLLIRSLGVLVGTLWEGTVTGGPRGPGESVRGPGGGLTC